MKDPVFCKQCKFYKQESFYMGYVADICIYKLNVDSYYTPFKIEYKFQNPIPEKHNANNDCPYYKEKLFVKLARMFR